MIYPRGTQAAAIRCYLLDHPNVRTTDVAQTLGCTEPAVSEQKKLLGIKNPRWHEAQKRRLTPRELDKLVLATVYDSGLVTAILDDDK